MTDKPSVLFACKANAGRSVTGKLLAEHYAGVSADVYSAGSEPGDHIHPEVAAVRMNGFPRQRQAQADAILFPRGDERLKQGSGDGCRNSWPGAGRTSTSQRTSRTTRTGRPRG